MLYSPDAQSPLLHARGSSSPEKRKKKKREGKWNTESRQYLHLTDCSILVFKRPSPRQLKLRWPFEFRTAGRGEQRGAGSGHTCGCQGLTGVCWALPGKPESVCKQSVLSQKCPRDLLQEVKLLKST